MFKNYLTVALRNLFLQKTISFINIAGLTLGLASFIVIFLYLQNELEYDKYNAHYDDIFRVVSNDYARTPAPLAEALRNRFPEIDNTVRIAKAEKTAIGVGEKKFYEGGILLADPSILSVFTLPLVDGNPTTALRDPLSVLLTQTAAKKYFGDADPVGRSMTFDHKFDLKVTGVLKDVPSQSHFHCDFLISMSSADELYGKDFLANRINTSVYTYLSLIHPSQSHLLTSQLSLFIKDYYSSYRFFAPPSLVLQRLPSIHLYSDLGGEIEPNGDRRYVYIFAAVDILILLMACINYMNILIARYSNRIGEIGVRKVLGAGN